VSGFSYIAWSLIQVTKGGSKAKFVWAKSQEKEIEVLNKCLCSTLLLTLPHLQQPFEIEIDALDYVIGIVLTHHAHLVASIVRCS